MKAETWVALGAAVVALLAIFLGPVATHLLSQRKDDRHWLRQQRTETYVDVLRWMHEIGMVVQWEDQTGHSAGDSVADDLEQARANATALLARLVLVGSDPAAETFGDFIEALLVWEDADPAGRVTSGRDMGDLYEKFGDLVRAEMVKLAGRGW